MDEGGLFRGVGGGKKREGMMDGRIDGRKEGQKIRESMDIILRYSTGMIQHCHPGRVNTVAFDIMFFLFLFLF